MVILEEPLTQVLKLSNYGDGERIESEPDQILDAVDPVTQKVITKVPNGGYSQSFDQDSQEKRRPQVNIKVTSGQQNLDISIARAGR